MKTPIFFIILFFTPLAFSAIPTVEGLFRNSSNKEVVAQGLVFTYSIEEQQNEILLQKTESESSEDELKEEMLKEKRLPIYVKQSMLLGEDKKSIQAIKYIYNSSEMKKTDLVRIGFTPNFNSKIINEFDPNKRLFHSLNAMFLLNDSVTIGTFLKDKGNGFKRNRDLLDPEKERLLERYKKYLIATKEDPDLREELSSPLNPTDLEERGKVLDLMKKNIYQKTNQVSLQKKEDNFRWNVNLGTIQVEFTNEGHRLKKFKYQADGDIEITTGDYVLFDGVHELPKILFFKANNDRVYKIRFLTLKYYQNYETSFKKRVKKLNDLKKEIRESGIIYKEHPLIL